MKIFVLTTGRSGSTTLYNACKQLKGFTVGHESKKKVIGWDRLEYSENHIEIDNRLSFFLGSLWLRYANDENVKFVYLERDLNPTAESFLRRWRLPHSIVRTWAEGVFCQLIKPKSETAEIAAFRYVLATQANIKLFLFNIELNRQYQTSLEDWHSKEERERLYRFITGLKMETLPEDYARFSIELSKPRNTSPARYKINFRYLIKEFWYRLR